MELKSGLIKEVELLFDLKISCNCQQSYAVLMIVIYYISFKSKIKC